MGFNHYTISRINLYLVRLAIFYYYKLYYYDQLNKIRDTPDPVYYNCSCECILIDSTS